MMRVGHRSGMGVLVSGRMEYLDRSVECLRTVTEGTEIEK